MAWFGVKQARTSETTRFEWRVTRLSLVAIACSLLFHALLLVVLRSDAAEDTGMHFELPSEVAFGVTEPELGAESAPAPAPPPAAKAEPKHSEAKRAPAPKTQDIVIPSVDAGAPTDAGEPSDASAADAATGGNRNGADAGEPAAISGNGFLAGANGEGGLGAGGEGTAYAPSGATIALNVDLERVRSTALLLEAQALIGIIPEWELLLAGSGIDPVKDISRVFVATPNLTRSSLVVSARAVGGRASIQAAVARLAADTGKPAPWRKERGFDVAPWRNRGPTERVLALLGDDQFVITRAADLGRVLAVAKALSKARAREGFSKDELARSGGLLAMNDDEAAAFWVEGVRRYVPKAETGVPSSLRFSIRRVDQFHTELRATGRYGSDDEAKAAFTFMDELRKEWTNNPRVIFLGLKNALETAELGQEGATLVLRVQLTLHQTRYLLGFVSKALTPRDAQLPAPTPAN